MSEAETPEVHFNVGDVVVVRQDFHSKYYRGMTGVIEGEAEKGGTAEMLWPVKIDVTPYRIYISGKYLQLKEEADREAAERAKERPVSTGAAASNGAQSGKSSFLSRIIPWRK